MNNYDVIVIGAGMSGLAAGIRLAMFDKKVCILEKHVIPGGLNSYYQRRNPLGGILEFDVGLHALTNYIDKGEKGKPFSKLLKQLRVRYDDFKLCPQTHSEIAFVNSSLKFSNDFELLKSEIASQFPSQIDGFNKLTTAIAQFDEVNLTNEYMSARKVVSQFISDELLADMIFAPLLIYGSAWEHDMDYSQFVIMFKSLFFEGFSRPEGGVRTILNILTEKFKSLGGELLYRKSVEKVLIENQRAIGVELKDGTQLLAPKILSSMGLPETLDRIEASDIPNPSPKESQVGKMTFTESIFVFDKKIEANSQDPTIVFLNEKDRYNYRKPETLIDKESAVICFPDNYHLDNKEGVGMVRVTNIANSQLWNNLDKQQYKEEKLLVEENARRQISLVLNNSPEIIFTDTFTPKTVEKYTWKKNGTVYGSEDKTRDGSTEYKGLYIIGTDQGFLGIVGAMLSGISMANLHCLME